MCRIEYITLYTVIQIVLLNRSEHHVYLELCASVCVSIYVYVCLFLYMCKYINECICMRLSIYARLCCERRRVVTLCESFTKGEKEGGLHGRRKMEWQNGWIRRRSIRMWLWLSFSRVYLMFLSLSLPPPFSFDRFCNIKIPEFHV